MVPLNDQLPAGLGSQLLQLVIKMESLPADGGLTLDFLADLAGEVEEVALAFVTPDAYTQKASLFGDFAKAGHHFARVRGGLQDQVGNDPVELVDSLEG